MKPKRPPKHLRIAGKSFWVFVANEYDPSAGDEILLTQASECLDRAESAREIVAREGITILDRFGQHREHPAAASERSSRLAFVRIRREMNLDAPPDDTRPPHLPSYH